MGIFHYMDEEPEVTRMARALRGLSPEDIEDPDKRRSRYLQAGISGAAALEPRLDAKALRYHKTWRDRIKNLKAIVEGSPHL